MAAFLVKIINLIGAPFFPPLLSLIYFLLLQIAHLNLLLAIFNLIPIPPLDGSKIFALILPEKEAAIYLSLSSVGIFILFFLLLFPVGGFSLGKTIYSILVLAEKLMGI